MDIALYISDILLEQDEVGIPGIGTFYKKTVAAHFDEEKQAFIPPGIQLAFRKENSDDRTLSRYISKQKNISEASSEYFAERFGDEILKNLKKDNRHEMLPLGVLLQDQDTLIFHAETISADSASFGLVPVKELDVLLEPEAEDPEIAAPEEQIQQPETPAEPDEEPVLQEVEDITIPEYNQPPNPTIVELENDAATQEDLNYREEPANEVNDTEIEEEEPAPRSNATKVILIIVVIALALAALGFIFKDQIQNFLQQYKQKPAPKEQKGPFGDAKTLADSTAVADSIVERKLAESGLTAEKTPDSLKAVDVTSTPVSEMQFVYEIDGPSFSTKANAEEYIKRKAKLGIAAHLYDAPGLRFHVSFGTFNDEASARAELPRIKQNIYSKATVQEVKKSNP